MTGRTSTLHTLAIVVGVVVGLAVSLFVDGVGGTIAGAASFAVIAAAAAGLVWLSAVPAELRHHLREASSFTERPPGDAVVRSLPLADRWSAASRRARPDLLAADFVTYEAGDPEPVSRERYLAAGRWPARAYRRGETAVDEVRVRPEDPTAVWVRVTCSVRPWVGRPLRACWWEAWTTTSDRERLRSRRMIAVLDVD